MMMKSRCAKVLAAIVGISFVPLYWIAQYSFPAADDFAVLKITAGAWNKTHSFSSVLQAAWGNAVNRFWNWQGNFSYVFSDLQPASFGEQYYGIASVIVLSALVLCELFFLKVLLKNYMQASRDMRWTISLLLVFLIVQFMYEPVEGIYWSCGAIPYTFFYAIGIWMDGLLLSMIWNGQENRTPKLLHQAT